jgi:hypothetical protein
MDCYLCLSESLTTAAAGICVECNRGVCLRPSRRRDRVVHGDQCLCGCKKVVCEADILDHATRAHSSSAPGCFPALAVVAAAPVLGGAVLSEAPASSLATRRAMTKFLNYITPGRDALWEARRTLRGQQWTRASLARDGRLLDVLLPPSFFTRARIARIRSLATTTLMHGLSGTDVSQLADRLEPRPGRTLRLLLALHPMRPAREWQFYGPADIDAVAEHLSRWLPAVDTTQEPVARTIDFSQPATAELARRTLEVDDEEPEESSGGSEMGAAH